MAANSTIGGFTAITGAGLDLDADSLGVYDQSAGTTKKITPNELASAIVTLTESFAQSGIGPIARNLQEKERERVTITDFMTSAQKADYIAEAYTLDLQAPIQSALDSGARRVKFPKGGGKVGSTLTISNNGMHLEFDSAFSATIKKAFNGDVFTIAAGAGEVVFDCPGIDGEGATYTGGGIKFETNTSGCKVITPRILDTADAGILLAGEGGSLLTVFGGLVQPTSTSTASIRLTSTDGVAAMNRHIIGMETGGGPIIDCPGCQTVMVVACGGKSIVTDANSNKVTAVGNRLQTAGVNMLIYGTDHVFTGNCVAGPFELAPGASNITVRGNTTVGAECINGSGNTDHNIELSNVSYTPVWTAASVNPAIGDGSIAGKYSVTGRRCKVDVALGAGGTTTFGTGEYSFSLPIAVATGAVRSVGSVKALDSGTAHLTGSVVADATSLTAAVFFNNTASAMSPTVPITWASGDQMSFTIEYDID